MLALCSSQRPGHVHSVCRAFKYQGSMSRQSRIACKDTMEKSDNNFGVPPCASWVLLECMLILDVLLHPSGNDWLISLCCLTLVSHWSLVTVSISGVSHICHFNSPSLGDILLLHLLLLPVHINMNICNRIFHSTTRFLSFCIVMHCWHFGTCWKNYLSRLTGFPSESLQVSTTEPQYFSN